MAKKMTKDTFYGSGKVYSVAYEEGMIDKDSILAKLEEIMVEDNQIGYLKNGFTFTVETETLTDQSDLGEMKIDTITKEKGKCDFSLFNASLAVIAEQYPTAKIASDTEDATIMEVGGLAGMDDTKHVIVFHHHDTQEGDTIAISVGKNMSGFSTAWKQDSVTPFPCSFEAQPYNDSGRFYMMVKTPVSKKWAD
ncbi:MAG: hypothetical protein ACI4XF_08830, partial [Oscillospiraceae bacterium]